MKPAWVPPSLWFPKGGVRDTEPTEFLEVDLEDPDDHRGLLLDYVDDLASPDHVPDPGRGHAGHEQGHIASERVVRLAGQPSKGSKNGS